MTRKKIEKFSIIKPDCFETDKEKIWFEIGCIDGLNAADEEPDTTKLWHDASEEPKEEEFILLEVINTRSEEDEVKYFIEYSRKWVVDSMKTEGFKCHWVYVKDLLPKGGEQ